MPPSRRRRGERALDRLAAHNKSPERSNNGKDGNKKSKKNPKEKPKEKPRDKEKTLNQQQDDATQQELRSLREEVARYKAEEEKRRNTGTQEGIQQQHLNGGQQQMQQGNQQLLQQGPQASQGQVQPDIQLLHVQQQLNQAGAAGVMGQGTGEGLQVQACSMTENPARRKQLSRCIIPFSDGQIQTTGSASCSSLLFHPRITDAELRRQAQHYFQAALKPNTRSTYSSGETRFIQFCIRHKLWDVQHNILPASEHTLVYFVLSLAQTVSYGTIKVYLHAVRNLHLEQGFEDPTKGSFLLDRIVQGIRNCKGEQPRRLRLPITLPILQGLCNKLELIFQNKPFDNLVYKTSFLVAFFGFLRVGEFTCDSWTRFDPAFHLQWDDVTFVPNVFQPSYIQIVIKGSKTDPGRKGVPIILGQTFSALCPVKALRELYLSRRYQEGPLFRLWSGTFLTRSNLTLVLRQALTMLGINSSHYASHSFRKGAATTAAERGIPPWLIQILGRWSSECYKLYISLATDQLKEVSFKA
ncbi:integrase/recombinase xerD homolog [Branchiostoma floridae x Branchiostoma japonicum]